MGLLATFSCFNDQQSSGFFSNSVEQTLLQGVTNFFGFSAAKCSNANFYQKCDWKNLKKVNKTYATRNGKIDEEKNQKIQQKKKITRKRRRKDSIRAKKSKWT